MNAREKVISYTYPNENDYPDYILKLNSKSQLIELKQISIDLKKIDRHNHYKLSDIIEDIEETYRELGWIE